MALGTRMLPLRKVTAKSVEPKPPARSAVCKKAREIFQNKMVRVVDSLLQAINCVQTKRN